jgi:hypothetical protein
VSQNQIAHGEVVRHAGNTIPKALFCNVKEHGSHSRKIAVLPAWIMPEPLSEDIAQILTGQESQKSGVASSKLKKQRTKKEAAQGRDLKRLGARAQEKAGQRVGAAVTKSAALVKDMQVDAEQTTLWDAGLRQSGMVRRLNDAESPCLLGAVGRTNTAESPCQFGAVERGAGSRSPCQSGAGGKSADAGSPCQLGAQWEVRDAESPCTLRDAPRSRGRARLARGKPKRQVVADSKIDSSEQECGQGCEARAVVGHTLQAQECASGSKAQDDSLSCSSDDLGGVENVAHANKRDGRVVRRGEDWGTKRRRPTDKGELIPEALQKPRALKAPRPGMQRGGL